MLPDTKELNAQTAFTTAHTKLTFLDANNSIFPPSISMAEHGNIKWWTRRESNPRPQ